MARNFVSNKDESVRMFKNNLLHQLSFVHYLTPLVVFGPVVLFFLYKSLFIQVINPGFVILFFLLGIFTWTLTEYILHRFVFHYHPTSRLGRRIHFLLHGVHHDYPRDSRRLVMAPIVSIPLAFFFYFLFYFTVGPVYVSPYFAGMVSGYIFYDLTHYALHHFNFKSKFWLTLKQHHALHHYQDAGKGFGVSTRFWDQVLQTMFSKKNNLSDTPNEE